MLNTDEEEYWNNQILIMEETEMMDLIRQRECRLNGA